MPLVACLVDTDRLTGGVFLIGDAQPNVDSEAPPHDATVDASEPSIDSAAPPTDATDDATDGQMSTDASDGGGIHDAAADADADADAGPFCPTGSTHSLCSDFDEGSLIYVPSGTEQWVQNGSPILAIDASVSPPGSLFSKVMGQNAPNEGTDNWLYFHIPSTTHGVYANFSVLPNIGSYVGTGSTASINIFEVVQNLGGNNFGMYIGFDNTGFFLTFYTGMPDGGGLTGNKYPLPPIPMNEWSRISVYEETVGSIGLSINGVSREAKTGITTTTNGSLGNQVVLGMSAHGYVPDSTVNIDNVTIDITP